MKLCHCGKPAREQRTKCQRHLVTTTPKPCAWCGNEFDSHPRYATTYCSHTCRAHDNAPKASELPTFTCIECGEWFYGNRGRKRCDACKPNYYRNNKAQVIEGARLRYQRQKAQGLTPPQLQRAQMKRAPGSERIEHQEVFISCGWICQLCHAAVDSHLSWPDLGSASLDHKQPISKGGTHTRANVQLAHLGCNMSKGNRGSFFL